MPPNDLHAQWCAEARRILGLKKPADRLAASKALAKKLLAQNGKLDAQIASLRDMVKKEPALFDVRPLGELAEQLRIARSQVNIDSYELATETQEAVRKTLDALIAAGKAQAKSLAADTLARSSTERARLKGALSDTLAANGRGAPSRETLAALRELAQAEFKRDAEHAAMQRNADALELGLPLPPARTAFADNATPSAAVWTEAVCEAAFKAWTWFDFKAFRKQGAAAQFRVPGLDAANCVITDDVMWRLYQYRRHVIDGLIKDLHALFPGRLLFSSNGSEDIESDLDITIASPRGGEDVEAMDIFNKRMRARFGRPPGRVFDTNLYARDYNAIKNDNMTRERDGAEPEDHDIAEPGGAMQKMANIDQDVATLMKQRRFMEADAFTAMWEELRDSMPEADREALQLRFEEAEDVYLLTAKAKVTAIEAKITTAIGVFDLEAYGAAHGDAALAAKLQAQEDFAARRLRLERIRAAIEAAGPGDDPVHELAEYQRQLEDFLGFMEARFEDETMEATDEVYAQRMAALRYEQTFIHEQEKALAESEPSEAERTEMLKAIAGAKARAKQAQFTNIVFANEAYVSQGAITHIVSGKQGGDASVLERIQPAELLQSSNEQMADFLKDMQHMEHLVPAGEVAGDGGAARRQATGEAFVHASKYLARMLEAVAMLEAKYSNQLTGKGAEAEAQLAALKRPYPLIQNAGAESAKALQTLVEGHLLKLRKSSTIPGDVKAEMGLAEAMALFDAADIPSLRTRIQAFCTEFNRRVRSLDDFRASQAVDDETLKEYFDPGAV